MLHLIKLAVGCAAVDDLAARQAERARCDPPLRHCTRAMPRRAAEILTGGSLYWVIGGLVQLRQRILAIRPDVWADGSPCCALELDPALVPVLPRPVKPFRGWRYLRPAEVPPDRADPAGIAALPPALRRELAALGLL